MKTVADEAEWLPPILQEIETQLMTRAHQIGICRDLKSTRTSRALEVAAVAVRQKRDDILTPPKPKKPKKVITP